LKYQLISIQVEIINSRHARALPPARLTHPPSSHEPSLHFQRNSPRRKEIEDLRDYYECELVARDELLAASRASAQLSPEDVAALTQETRVLRMEAEERERLLQSTQQLLKIAQVVLLLPLLLPQLKLDQEQLFKGASSQGEHRGQMCVTCHTTITLSRMQWQYSNALLL